jgi:hypothetical protein
MAILSKTATAYTVLALTRLEGRFLRYGGIPGAFSGGGLASALWSLDSGFRNLFAASRISGEPPLARRGDEWRRDRRACRRKGGPAFLITSVEQLEIKGAFSMGNQTAKAHDEPSRSGRCGTRCRGEYSRRLRRPRAGFVRKTFDAAGRG